MPETLAGDVRIGNNNGSDRRSLPLRKVTQLRKVGIYQFPFPVQDQGGSGLEKLIFKLDGHDLALKSRGSRQSAGVR